MPDRIRFTLIEDEQDVRSYDFDTDEVQIGADPERGDNLLIKLPPKLRHVRVKIFRTPDYVEMEVKTGPVWVQNSRMEEGDVVELNVGDLLIFGTKRPRGVRMRFEYATEASIFMDDVADWSVSASPKKKRKTADDDLAFDEEVDPMEGMNFYQKALYKYRQGYAGFAKWRKKASRVKYWISAIGILWTKVGKGLLIFGGMGGLAVGWFVEADKKTEAVEAEEVAVLDEASAVRQERESFLASAEIERQLRECNCPGAPGEDKIAILGTEALLGTFGAEDDTFAPQRPVALDDRTSQSLSELVGSYLNAVARNKRNLRTNLDRICSSLGGRKMQAVQAEVKDHGLHEVYAYIPFVEAQWCEMAVDPFGRRGMMQMSRTTAKAAFVLYDKPQSKIPKQNFDEHVDWLEAVGRRRGRTGALVKCDIGDRDAYIQQFYGGKRNADHPERVDPDDARTDWKASMAAAYTLLEEYDRDYRKKGFKPVDAAMLSLAAYDTSPGLVQKWVDAAQKKYGIEEEGTLTYMQVYGGAVAVWGKVKGQDKKDRISEAMKYAPRVVAYYLHAGPRLADQKCTD
jgi:hypothetical protein